MKRDWQDEAKKLHASGLSMLEIASQLNIDPSFVCALLKPALGKDKKAGFKAAANRKRFQRR